MRRGGCGRCRGRRNGLGSGARWLRSLRMRAASRQCRKPGLCLRSSGPAGLLEPVEGILGEGFVSELLGRSGVETGDGGVDPGLRLLVALVLIFTGPEKAFEFVGVVGAACFWCLAVLRTR